MIIKMGVNGDYYEFDVSPDEKLSGLLREIGMKSVKHGCGEGNCGSCAVLVDGRPRNSCLMLAAQAHECEVITCEGLGNPEDPHPIQQAFVDSGSTQCGFCNPGSLIAATALLSNNPDPTPDEVKEALDGNLCRCTGYVKRIEAVLDVAARIKKADKPARGKK